MPQVHFNDSNVIGNSYLGPIYHLHVMAWMGLMQLKVEEASLVHVFVRYAMLEFRTPG